MYHVKWCLIKLCDNAGAQKKSQYARYGARALARAVGVNMNYSEEEKGMWQKK